MHRIAQTIITALLLLLVGWIVPTSALAAAEPAVPYRTEGCYEQLEPEGLYEICYSSHGVIKSEQNPSGKVLYKASGKSSFAISLNGEEIYRSADRGNTVILEDRDGTHVYHGNTESEYTMGGQTCTTTFMLTYANNEVRQSVYEFQCSP